MGSSLKVTLRLSCLFFVCVCVCVSRVRVTWENNYSKEIKHVVVKAGGNLKKRESFPVLCRHPRTQVAVSVASRAGWGMGDLGWC